MVNTDNESVVTGNSIDRLRSRTPKICQRVAKDTLHAGVASWKMRKKRKKTEWKRGKKAEEMNSGNLIDSLGNIRGRIYLIIFTARWNPREWKGTLFLWDESVRSKAAINRAIVGATWKRLAGNSKWTNITLLISVRLRMVPGHVHRVKNNIDTAYCLL